MAVSTSVQTERSTAPTPKFVGVLGGELYKITRHRTTWLMLMVPFAILVLFWFGLVFLSNQKTHIDVDPLRSVFQNATGTLSLLRVFSGFVLTILTARLIGLDYQQGTIRIILARGVGRLQLLMAKLLAMTIIAFIVLIVGIALDFVLCFISYRVVTGSTDVFNVLTSQIWNDLWLYILTIAISMEVTVLLTTAVTVLGRSVAMGVGVGLSFFAADNIAVGIMFIIRRVIQNDFWLNITGYFLGPNLNVMPTTWIGTVATSIVTTPDGQHLVDPLQAVSLGTTPLVGYDTTHILVLTLVYAIIFAVIAFGLTWRRDVLE
jgi:ABC-2 type transport system permease protein